MAQGKSAVAQDSRTADGVAAQQLFREGFEGLRAPRRGQSRYTIGELVERFQLTSRALRFYEEKGLLQPARSGNWRLYSDYDLERLKLVVMGKRIGLPISSIREILSVHDEGKPESELLRFTLAKVQEQADVLKEEERQIQTQLEEVEGTCMVLSQLLSERQRLMGGAARRKSRGGLRKTRVAGARKRAGAR